MAPWPLLACSLCLLVAGPLLGSLALEKPGSGRTHHHHEHAKMDSQEKGQLRDEAREMFYHAYNSYLDNAFPADELMPLSCKGRFRGREPNRGDVDDALGNFSLTLIDALDTLVVMNDYDAFETGVKLVVDNVNFDYDITVSVFETNIRVVGGLVSAHILAEWLRDKQGYMGWYSGELLNLALDVGYRLLPAFNSTTGLPHPRVNLRYGIKAGKVKAIGETCTACAGTMILEFAALSRLTGDPIFEEKASAAMDVLWSSRHRMSNLVGNVLNINTGDWVRRDSGVGAGIDSYYEYVAKAYVLLGEDKYLDRWQVHYAAVMKYVGGTPLLQDVHMHRPHSNSRHFVDALGAFWPGLQVLMGDVKPAIESHEIHYQVMERHNFIPEAFTTDYQVHWGWHLLRPEFIESTYFLYKATDDQHYLHVGKKALRALQQHARVDCGFATIKDVRTLQKEDRMDSFVLAETFKYLYLLFAEDEDLGVDVHNFVFTTEGHLLPLSLARLSNRTAVPLKDGAKVNLSSDELEVEFAQSCPSTDFLFPGVSAAKFAHEIRQPLANTVLDKCPIRKTVQRRLYASDFQSDNPKHLLLIKDMGINLVSLPDGRVQLLHTFANAKTTEDGEEGLLFMQEMIELSKQQQQSLPETPPRLVTYQVSGDEKPINMVAGPAQFGMSLEEGLSVNSEAIVADPSDGCSKLNHEEQFWGKIAVVERGSCMFVEKARNLESLGALGVIVIDNVAGSTSEGNPLFAMSGDGTDDVSIPVVFLFQVQGKQLLKALEQEPTLKITIADAKLKPAAAPQISPEKFKHFLDTFQEVFKKSLSSGKKEADLATALAQLSHTESEQPSATGSRTKIFRKSLLNDDDHGEAGDKPSSATTLFAQILEEMQKQLHLDGDSEAALEEDMEESSTLGGFDFTTPVAELLERSRRHVEHYFTGSEEPEVVVAQTDTDSKIQGPAPDAAVDTNSKLNPDQDHGSSTATEKKETLILPKDSSPALLDLDRLSDLLSFVDSKFEPAGIILEDANAYANLVQSSEAVLVKLFLQALWEEPQLSVEQALKVTVTLASSGLGKQHIDQAVALYVDRALAATQHGGAFAYLAEIVRASLDSRASSETLREFIVRMSQFGSPSGYSESVYEQLAVHPVLTSLFSGLKQYWATLRRDEL